MAKTRTLFAAVVAVLGFAGTANAQTPPPPPPPSITITTTGYQAANSRYPATTQPEGNATFPALGGQTAYTDYRVVVDYGFIYPGTTTWTPYSNGGNTRVSYSQPITPGLGGTKLFPWAVGLSGWPAGYPMGSNLGPVSQMRARLQKRAAFTNNPAVDWPSSTVIDSSAVTSTI